MDLTSHFKPDGNDSCEDQAFVNNDDVIVEGVRAQEPVDKAAFRHRFLHTVCVCLGLLALGWRNSMIGPTLPDLRLIMNEDLSAAAWLFTAKSLGGLVGSLCCGYAYDRFNKILLLTILISFMGVFAGVVPWCDTLSTMLVVHAAHGLCGAGLDTAATADVFLVWRHRAGPYMQALHGAFSIGTIIAPFVCEPFLVRPSYSTVFNTTMMNSSYYKHKVIYNETTETNMNVTNNESFMTSLPDYNNTSIHNGVSSIGDTQIFIPYLITMGVCLLVTLSFILPTLCYGDVYNKSVVTETESDNTNSDTKYFLDYRMKVVFTVLLAITLSVYTISEYCFAGFLMTFLITELNWTKTSGSTATSTFWIAFAAGRLTGIFVVEWCRLSVVLVVFMIICAIGTVLFWVSVSYDVTVLTWLSIAVTGYGMSVIFPSIFSWLSDNVRRLTGKTCSILFVAVSIGTMTVPKLVGYMMDKESQLWFIYAMVALGLSMLALFIVILVMFNILERRRSA